MTVYTYTMKAKVARLGILTTSGTVKSSDEYQALCAAVREGREPFEKAGITPDKLSVEVVAHPELEIS